MYTEEQKATILEFLSQHTTSKVVEAFNAAVENPDTKYYAGLAPMFKEVKEGTAFYIQGLLDLMEWSTTPQGFDFWDDLYVMIDEIDD